MGGMVFGSVGTPLSPWQVAQSCTFASIGAWARTGGAAARPSTTPDTTEKTRMSMTILLPPRSVRQNVAGYPSPIPNASQVGLLRESLMRANLILALAATVAAMVLPNVVYSADAQPALTGTVSSEAEGKMEGVVVTAHQAGSIVEVSVTTNAEGRYSFPRTHLKPGEYTLATRAVGYDLDYPGKATVASDKAATADIRLKKTKNLAGQLTNAEWLM